MHKIPMPHPSILTGDKLGIPTTVCSGYDDSHLWDNNSGDGCTDSRRDMPRAANLDTNDAMVEGACVFVCRGRVRRCRWKHRQKFCQRRGNGRDTPIQTCKQNSKRTATGGSYVSTCSCIDSYWAGLMDKKHANGKAPYLLVVLSKPLANSTLCFSFAW
jgi:hypothetical protein